MLLIMTPLSNISDKASPFKLTLDVEADLVECLLKQARTKYLRKTLVCKWNSALREKFNCYFQGVFC